MAVSIQEKMESHSPNLTGDREKRELKNTENDSVENENNDQSEATQTDAEGKGRVTENGNTE